MLLGEFFEDQIDQLFGFFAALEERVRCVQVAPDIREFVVKLLAGLQDDPAYHHVMLICEAPFESAEQYTGAVLDLVREHLDVWRGTLEERGIHLDWPESVGPWRPPQRLVHCCSALADSLPEETGALVLVLLPAAVADATAFRQTLEFLARETESIQAKFLLVDDQAPPIFDAVPEALADRIGLQSFGLSPEIIENSIREGLANPEALAPREARQYLAMLGSFAFARHDYVEAQRLQEDLLEKLGPDGPGDERAGAFYNLGNTLLSSGDAPMAERCFAEALDLAGEHGAVALVPMSLTNLGVALHRQGKIEEALEAFHVAREHCQANQADLLEAHVLDSLARTYQMEDRHAEAERCWQEALGIYERLQSSAAAPIKKGGSADIVDKLTHLYKKTLQTGKLHDLEAAVGRN